MSGCIRELNEEKEFSLLSPYATKSKDSRGRLLPEEPCTVRTAFQRDIGRILYCEEFRRLRQKTQVFFNPRNDHISTRMEHVIYVAYIAKTIAVGLSLNTQLVEAIAMGHDIGHAPFGHSGERELNRCLVEMGSSLRFHHEAHGLRVVDCLSHRKEGVYGLNLSFEVRDGIISHCGETYQETELRPHRSKTEKDVQETVLHHDLPATLEGCVVRMADKIAYIGRDIEDAARSGLMSFDELPKKIKTELGRSNGEIINTLVTDLIENSQGQDRICLSKSRAEGIEALLRENVSRIYQSNKIRRYEMIVRDVIEGLFESFIRVASDPERLASLDEEPYRRFSRYLADYPEQEALVERKVVDYIAGMTDHYAYECFQSLYQI